MRRKILIFGLQFVPILLACVWIYPRVLPAYQRVVVAGVDVGLHRFDPPMRIEIAEDGGWRTFVLFPDGSESYYWYRPGANLNLTYLGLALLPALLLSTPVPLRHRLRLLLLGLVILVVLHVLAGVGLVWSIRCLANSPGTAICIWVKTIVNTYGQLMTVVVWGLLTWDVWLPHRVTAASQSSPDAGVPPRP